MITIITEPASATTAVNFIRNDEKVLDWRYETYQSFRFCLDSIYQKKIYWIGAIELEKVREAKTLHPIQFADGRWELRNDAEVYRDVDGADLGSYDQYRYNLEKILPALLTARKEGKIFFNVFLEETAEGDGAHTVSLLYNPKSHESKLYGFPGDKPWFELPIKELARYSNQKIDHLEKIPLLGNAPYEWLK